MAHKTFEVLAALLETAAEVVDAGQEYRHYKDPNSRYTVTGFTILEATDEVAVRYAPVQAPQVELTRPMSSWLAVVEYEGHPVPRFTKI